MNEICCSLCNEDHKLSDRVFKKHNGKGTFKCRSCIIKNKWQDPEYKKKIAATQKQIWSSEKTRDKISTISKKLWENSEYKRQQHIIHSNTEYKRITSENSKKLWEDENFRSNQIKIRSDPDWKIKQSRALKKVWDRPGHKQKMALVISNFLKSGKRSSIEETTFEILNLLNFDFQEQKIIGPYIFDFFIQEYDLLIECQGEYWHSFDNVKKKDAAKFTYIDKYFPHYKILYLHERDFLNPGIIKQKITKHSFNFIQYQKYFSFDDLNIMRINKLSMEKFLNSFHYAQSVRNCKRVIGAFLDNTLIAVCKFASVVRKEVATSLILKTSEVLELEQICIHPQYKKENYAS